MLIKKNRRPFEFTELSRLYAHCRYNRCSWITCICDNLNTFVLRKSNSNVVHVYFFLFATEFLLAKRNSTLLFILKTEEECSFIKETLRKWYKNWTFHKFQKMTFSKAGRQTYGKQITRSWLELLTFYYTGIYCNTVWVTVNNSKYRMSKNSTEKAT